MSHSWKEYREKSKNRRPRPLLVEAIALAEGREEALDLGPGAMNDTKFLVDSGFKCVAAVDITPPDPELMREFPEGAVSYIVSPFDQFAFPPAAYDLINAQFSLPFNPRGTFDEVFSRIIASLKPGGIFVGNLFGDRDEWNKPDSKLTFHASEDARELFVPLELIKLVEEEKEGKTALGKDKHWHIFHFIAKKK